MAETNGNGGGLGGDMGPQLNALAQYTKDLSFENPNAPNSLGPQEKGPNISIQVNVNARQLSETDFEVSLRSKARPARAPTRCSSSSSTTPACSGSATSRPIRSIPSS